MKQINYERKEIRKGIYHKITNCKYKYKDTKVGDDFCKNECCNFVGINRRKQYVICNHEKNYEDIDNKGIENIGKTILVEKLSDINNIEKEINKIIEDIQKAIVDSGGRFFKQEEIKEMKVEYLIRLLMPNNVKFNVYYDI